MAKKKTTTPANLSFMDELRAAAALAVRSDCERQHEQ
jgi:hypothetical protein